MWGPFFGLSTAAYVTAVAVRKPVRDIRRRPPGTGESFSHEKICCLANPGHLFLSGY